MRRISLILIAVTAVIAFFCASAAAASLQGVTFNWPSPPQKGEPDYFAIAHAGKAACCIVVPAKPTEQEQASAELLRIYLGLVTGGTFEVKREPATGPAIYIGETGVGKKLALDIPPMNYASITLPNVSGFLIATVDKNTLVIRGVRDAAVSHAVVSLLREFVGVMRYWPTEPGGIGDVYEKQPDLTLPKLTWRDWPYFIARRVGFQPAAWEAEHPEAPDNMWRWYREGHPLAMMHNFNALIPVAEYGKTHPEYFPEINGKRVIPAGKINWQPCVSNPEVVEICARKINEAFDRNPDLICHALAVNDGIGDCCCAKCRAMDAPTADVNTWQLTDRYVKFMDAVAARVAAKHPDKLIGFLSYASIAYPPTTVRVAPNLVVYHCAMARGIYEDWDKWIAAGAQNMGHYGYHDDSWFIIPKVNPHQEARRIRYMVSTDVARGYYKEFYSKYFLDIHAATVYADMLWDPRLDENKILADFYNRMFRESASQMRTFYETLEADYESWVRRTSKPTRYGYDRSDLDLDHNYEQFQVLSPTAADKAWRALLDAEGRAVDPKVKQRIALIKSVFRFVWYCDHEYWNIKALESTHDLSKAERLARETLALAREKALIKQNVIEGSQIKPYMALHREPYDQIKVGVVPEEVYMAIDRALTNVLAASPGNRATMQKLAADADPTIASAAASALAMASAAPANLINNPGFEGPPLPALVNDLAKPALIAISPEKPHSGSRCLKFWDCLSSSVSYHLNAKPGEKYWVSVWLRAKDFQGVNVVHPKYGLKITAKGGAKTLNFYYAAAKPGSEWMQVKVPFTTPARTDALEVQISAVRQHAKGRLWIDDLSVRRVPIEPLKLDEAGQAPTIEVGPPEN